MNASTTGVLEVLTRSGQVLHRQAYHGGRLTIGRAYDNDVIVGDPYVDPHHLELDAEDGELVVRDLGSVNGTWVVGEPRPVERTVLRDDTTVQIGHSQLRFRSARATVAPAWRDTARHGLVSLFSRSWVPVAAVAAALLAWSLDQVMSTAGTLRFGVLASRLIWPLMGLMLWAGVWALLNRLIAHRANFTVHLAIASLGLALLYVTGHGVALLGFAFAWDEAVRGLRALGQVVIVAGVLFSHLQYASHARAWKQAAGSLTLATLLIGAPMASEELQRDDFSSLPQLQPLIRPPAFRVREGQDPEAFLAAAEALRQEVDEAASEAQSR